MQRLRIQHAGWLQEVALPNPLYFLRGKIKSEFYSDLVIFFFFRRKEKDAAAFPAKGCTSGGCCVLSYTLRI